MIETKWTREQVEDLLKRERFRYQRIALPYGLFTEGNDRSATARQILPDDLTGKTVLDVGCSHGFFCFEAKRRGAKRVVGVDVESDVIRKNRLLADCLGLDVEFSVHNIEQAPISESFDYVICLNVLHHLLNPFSALENLVAVAKEKLILEMASFGAHDRTRLRLFPFYGYLLSKAPIVYVSRSGTSGRRELKRYFITPKAVDHMLRYHRQVFARVDFEESEFKERYIVKAEKQRIDHLVLVAGPTASGKTTFCKELMAGQLGNLAPHLDIGPEKEERTYLSPRVSTNPGIPHIKTAVYHYDLLRPFMRSARVHDRDEALDVLSASKKITVLTLWTSPEKLRAQHAAAKGWFEFPTKRERQIRADYQSPRLIVEHYDRWFDFLARKGLESKVVDFSKGGRELITLAEWRQMVEPLRSQG
jgi:SAM-dependent methyltransferase